MIIVVFGHVETYGFFNFSYTTILGNLFQSVQMPLFFFISGFVVYKERPVRNWSKFFSLVVKKAQQLLLPALVVGLIYTYTKSGTEFNEFISDAAKKGYWFTISLFEMFLIYYFMSALFNRYEKDGLWVLLAISFICFLMKLPFKAYPWLNEIGNYTSLHFTFNHFQFMVIGMLTRKYFNIIVSMLERQMVKTMTILIFFLLFYLQITLSPMGGMVGKVVDTILECGIAYPSIYLLFMLFNRHYESSFMNGALEYVGKRTLDIYLLHYFLLPALPMVGEFLKSYPNVILECLVGFTLAILIVIVALFISRIIRVSQVLGMLVLGANKSSK